MLLSVAGMGAAKLIREFCCQTHLLERNGGVRADPQ